MTENGQEKTYHFVATVTEIKQNGQLTRWVEEHDILLYEYGGKIKALSNICRHFGGPVGYHKAQEGIFTCLWHNWQFSAKDGACLTYPGYPLRTYTLKLIGDDIYVNLLS